MRKLGAVAATGAVLALALAAWTRPLPPAQGGGTVSGKVKFTGTKPAMPKIDMTEEPKCKAKYQGVPTDETVVVNANGTLADVFVYVKSGLPASYAAPAPTGPVTLDQDGCRYHPHVLGIQAGQTLAISSLLLTTSAARSMSALRRSSARLPRLSGTPSFSRSLCVAKKRKGPNEMKSLR